MKNSIKVAAINIFHAKGYFATSINEIAQAVGIRKSSIYHHYGSKEDLLFEILQESMVHLQQELTLALEDKEDPLERLAEAIDCHICFHIDHQKEAFLADTELRGLNEKNRAVILVYRKNYEQIFQDIIREGISVRTFTDTDVKVASYGVLTMCTSVAIWFRAKGRLSKNDVAEIYSNLILEGLKSKV